jgi:hypothetical protein
VYAPGYLNTVYDSTYGVQRQAHRSNGTGTSGTDASRTSFGQNQAPPAEHWTLGDIMMTSGANAGHRPVNAGDTFAVQLDCDSAGDVRGAVREPRALSGDALHTCCGDGDVMDEAMRTAVVKEALTWLGTPYHHHARVKGVGVDCTRLLCAVYEACGCVPHIDPGNYAHDWHLHRGEEVFIGWLEKAGAREVQTPARGDAVLFRFGRAYSHGAVIVDDRCGATVAHAYVGRGVIQTRLNEEPLLGRVGRFWRLRG